MSCEQRSREDVIMLERVAMYSSYASLSHPLKLKKNLLFIYLFLAAPRSLWDLSSLTRDGTQAPGSGSAES